MTATMNLKQLGQDALDRVAALRDEIKLKLHLASLEARDAWQELVEPQLLEIERRLKEIEKENEEAFHHDERGMRLTLALMEARDRLDAIEPYLAWWREQARAASEKIAAAPDVARLKAHLARLDAKDALERRKEKARAALADANRALTEIGGRIRSALGLA